MTEEAYQLLSKYSERKVQSGIVAIIYAYNHKPEDKAEAEKLPDETLSCYEEFIAHIKEHVKPLRMEMYGEKIENRGRDLKTLLAQEKKDREQLSKIFDW